MLLFEIQPVSLTITIVIFVVKSILLARFVKNLKRRFLSLARHATLFFSMYELLPSIILFRQGSILCGLQTLSSTRVPATQPDAIQHSRWHLRSSCNWDNLENGLRKFKAHTLALRKNCFRFRYVSAILLVMSLKCRPYVPEFLDGPQYR